jgi:osmotically-inducible protein OsmY
MDRERAINNDAVDGGPLPRRGSGVMAKQSAQDLERRAQSALMRRAQSALMSSSVYPLRELIVESQNDAILITGSVNSFYHKQLAQEAVRAVVGAIDVVNSVQVQEQ